MLSFADHCGAHPRVSGMGPARSARPAMGLVESSSESRTQTGGCRVFRNGVMKILRCAQPPCAPSFSIL